MEEVSRTSMPMYGATPWLVSSAVTLTVPEGALMSPAMSTAPAAIVERALAAQRECRLLR